MARYDVTPELAATLKSIRIQHQISSKSVAEHIGKSQSFMSKLEKGDIKTIEETELTRILRFIFNYDDSNDQDFLNATLSTILDTLVLRFSQEEIDKQLWFYNYDTVLRLIPIPVELIEEISSRMSAMNLTSQYLCERINANEGISPKVTNSDAYPFNEWQAFVVDHRIEFSFIKMKLSSQEIDDILSRRIQSTNYVTLLSIVYYIFKIEAYGDQVTLEGPLDTRLMQEATDLLSSYKFFSLSEKNALRRKAQTQEEKDALLSSFDRENGEVIKEILAAFHVFSELDIARTTDNLIAFVKNLRWDRSFMMKLISTSFYEIEDISFSAKKEMLAEIQSIFTKYKELPEEKRRVEVYD